MKPREPFSTAKRAIRTAMKDRTLVIEGAAIVAAFHAGAIPPEEFCEMAPLDRGLLAAAVAGRFAFFHPEEAFDWLKQAGCACGGGFTS